jgi:DNA-binding transcriptional MocR family regulator
MSTLYEQLAESLAQRIRDGQLRAGDRLPSVRQACAQAQVSAATVFQAYYLLEGRGLIEARPRSGYYVCKPSRGQARAVLAAEAAPVATESTEVAISELVFEVLGSTRDREVVPLGSAFPSPELFPLERLARAGARAMRHLAPQALTAELTAGNTRLREALRARYTRQGISVNADDPVITNGAMGWPWRAPPSMPRCRPWSACTCAPSRSPPTRRMASTPMPWPRCCASTAWPPAG